MEVKISGETHNVEIIQEIVKAKIPPSHQQIRRGLDLFKRQVPANTESNTQTQTQANCKHLSQHLLETI